MTHTVEWFFGRGVSIGCGLTWAVPAEWHVLPREEQIARISAAIVAEMSSPNVNTSDIIYFLDLLKNHTTTTWQHRFHTTNWDYLLQRELLSLDLTVQPPWCANTHVYHLNGTVEQLPNNAHRSKFVLESDPPGERANTTEGNDAFGRLIWSKTFVVVGMSFECEVDKYLLTALSRVQDDLPIGESYWVVVNPNESALSTACLRLQAVLPRATINANCSSFGAWLRRGAPELQSRGAIAF